MHKFKLIMPFLILLLLLSVLVEQLFFGKRNELPSALIGRPVPSFVLSTLAPSDGPLSNQDFLGRAVLLNVWATWCQACAYEHPMLMKIKNEYHVPIYGLDYKDNPDDAKLWLKRNGDPYVSVGSDVKGDVAIDFGVYGTPETFIISQQGRITYRHVGVLDEKTWKEVLWPIFKKANSHQAASQMVNER
jgi:cytochrome c biogenesis protein CcmG/thiol:disulfide interchange protein DsbE